MFWNEQLPGKGVLRKAAYFVCFFLVLVSASTLISKPLNPEPAEVTARPVLTDGHPSEVHTGGLPGTRFAKVDTVYLLGGPGRNDGDFEDGSAPSWDG